MSINLQEAYGLTTKLAQRQQALANEQSEINNLRSQFSDLLAGYVPFTREFVGKIESYRYRVSGGKGKHTFRLNCSNGIVLAIECSGNTLDKLLSTFPSAEDGEMDSIGKMLNNRYIVASTSTGNLVPMRYVGEKPLSFDSYDQPLFIGNTVLIRDDRLVGRIIDYDDMDNELKVEVPNQDDALYYYGGSLVRTAV